MKNYFLLFFNFLFFQLHGQITFQKLYGDLNSENSIDHCISHDGNYVSAGYYTDVSGTKACITKSNVIGNILWRKVYSGLIEIASIFSTMDGGFVMTGSTDSLVQGDNDMFILKSDSVGNVQWCKVYGKTTSSDQGSNVFENSNKEIYLVGEGYNYISGDAYGYIIKTDSTGILLWDKVLHVSTQFQFLYVAHASPTADNGIIVTGIYPVNFIYKLLLMKIDSLGQTSWIHCFENSNNLEGWKSFQAIDGGYISSGWGSSPGIQNGFVLLKTNSNGNSEWCKVYSDAITLPDLIINADGDYLLAGAHGDGIVDSANIYLIKTDQQGDTIWTKFYELDKLLYKGEVANRIIQTSDGGYFIGSRADRYQDPYSENYLLKADAVGDAGCNQVFRQITVESVIPLLDTNVTTITGINSTSLTISASNSQIPDTTLCLQVQIQEIEKNIFFEIYPNPTTDYLKISFPFISPGYMVLEISDIMGREMMKQRVNPEWVESINVSNFSKGVYIVRIRGKNKSCVKYFCKQ